MKIKKVYSTWGDDKSNSVDPIRALDLITKYTRNVPPRENPPYCHETELLISRHAFVTNAFTRQDIDRLVEHIHERAAATIKHAPTMVMPEDARDLMMETVAMAKRTIDQFVVDFEADLSRACEPA